MGDPHAIGQEGSQDRSIRQIETVGAGDLENLYFAWAAVGLVPTDNLPHDDDDTPYFRIERNWHPQGGGTVVLQMEDAYAGNIGSINPGWVQGATHDGSPGQDDAGIWFYRPREIFAFNFQSYGTLPGVRTEAILTTRDCDPSGHASHAYLDGFGSTPPPIPVVPEPSTVVRIGLGLASVVAGGLRIRRRQAVSRPARRRERRAHSGAERADASPLPSCLSTAG